MDKMEEEENPSHFLVSENIRTFSVIYLWLELSCTLFLMFSQLVHLWNEKRRPRTLNTFPLYSNQTFVLSGQYLQDSLWLDMKLKLYNVAVWSVIICSDLVPMMAETLNMADSEFDFFPTFLPLSLRQDISFALSWALFDLLVIEFPQSFFRQSKKKSYGFYKESMLFWTEQELQDLVYLIFHQTFISIIVVLFMQAFECYTAELFPILRYLILAIFCMIGRLSYFYVLLKIEFQEKANLVHLEPRSPLYEQVKKLCAETGFSIKNVFIDIVDPDETWMNAYCVSYFGTITQIIFTSTIIDKYPTHPTHIGLNTRELEGIFAHEIGHWYHSHNEKMSMTLDVFIEPVLFCLSVWIIGHDVVFEAFHLNIPVESAIPLLPGLFVAQMILLRWLTKAVEGFSTVLSRYHEAEADRFSQTLRRGRHLQEGLVAMYEYTLSYPSANKLFSLFYQDHASLVDRIEEIDKAIL